MKYKIESNGFGNYSIIIVESNLLLYSIKTGGNIFEFFDGKKNEIITLKVDQVTYGRSAFYVRIRDGADLWYRGEINGFFLACFSLDLLDHFIFIKSRWRSMKIYDNGELVGHAISKRNPTLLEIDDNLSENVLLRGAILVLMFFYFYNISNSTSSG
ncbi:hypothetical protein LX64_03339 [Chitinophaga skermanii]|uniref:Uncharacterized protein n=1 Tax=Chitinophaga skermanii TaxID=331697 RepID=A0A327QEM8_9BACT|nr:hypothetical protein [Chitinophaga skermanii]RAJ02328.1 hypothetical protein LX64_03339 [Chitinophaga skermanii]